MEFEILSFSFTTTDAILLVGTGICVGAIGTVLGILIFGRNYKKRIAAIEQNLGIHPEENEKEMSDKTDTKNDENEETYTLGEMFKGLWTEMNDDAGKIVAWYFGLIHSETPSFFGVMFFLMTIPIVFLFAIGIIFTPVIIFLELMEWLHQIQSG